MSGCQVDEGISANHQAASQATFTDLNETSVPLPHLALQLHQAVMNIAYRFHMSRRSLICVQRETVKSGNWAVARTSVMPFRIVNGYVSLP